LAEPAAVRMEVLDVAGKRVRLLMNDTPMPAGNHTVDWRGRGDDGRLLAAGVYLVRMLAAGVERIEAVTLLK